MGDHHRLDQPITITGIRNYDYDIVLLDLMLPDMDGCEVVRRMRSNRIEAPVIVMSGLTRPQDKVKAFSVGADDFITKPFDSTELLARMKAIVRRRLGLPALRRGSPWFPVRACWSGARSPSQLNRHST